MLTTLGLGLVVFLCRNFFLISNAFFLTSKADTGLVSLSFDCGPIAIFLNKFVLLNKNKHKWSLFLYEKMKEWVKMGKSYRLIFKNGKEEGLQGIWKIVRWWVLVIIVRIVCTLSWEMKSWFWSQNFNLQIFYIIIIIFIFFESDMVFRN